MWLLERRAAPPCFQFPLQCKSYVYFACIYVYGPMGIIVENAREYAEKKIRKKNDLHSLPRKVRMRGKKQNREISTRIKRRTRFSKALFYAALVPPPPPLPSGNKKVAGRGVLLPFFLRMLLGFARTTFHQNRIFGEVPLLLSVTVEKYEASDSGFPMGPTRVPRQ